MSNRFSNLDTFSIEGDLVTDVETSPKSPLTLMSAIKILKSTLCEYINKTNPELYIAVRPFSFPIYLLKINRKVTLFYSNTKVENETTTVSYIYEWKLRSDRILYITCKHSYIPYGPDDYGYCTNVELNILEDVILKKKVMKAYISYVIALLKVFETKEEAFFYLSK